ncbi:hypothetical protein Aasi_0412 [Candidatus Amoebophilus asiaticus 5a2]|uniref:Bacterial toxin 50 domain-containing protein n=1 Tax=Amoebophilus asiaticus (strain 5a2) TaxID=452471 RepID=B3ERH6_AMOA5|nr:hypothetical protein [Candidatus Amoebophilus asiaticus]ACE05828.1 hypothetical protein Aasi_0412 [Candidatus Amoebophilus asiaticus 5a2]
MPETPEEWAGLALTVGLDFVPFGKALKFLIGPGKKVVHGKVKNLLIGLLKKREKKICTKFLKSLNKRISIQKQARHVAGTAEKGKGFMHSLEDAQAVLDAIHAGKAEFIGVSKAGHQVFRVNGITGTHVNVREKVIGQRTNVFAIKGTINPSIVPTKPDFKPFFRI